MLLPKWCIDITLLYDQIIEIKSREEELHASIQKKNIKLNPR